MRAVSDGVRAPNDDLVLRIKEDLWGAWVIARRELWANMKSFRSVVMVLLLALIMLGAATGFTSQSGDDGDGETETSTFHVVAMDEDAVQDDLIVFAYTLGTNEPLEGRNVSLAYESEFDPSLRTRTDARGIAVLKNLTRAFHVLNVELRQEDEGGFTTGMGVTFREDVRTVQIYVPGIPWSYPSLYLNVGSSDLDDDNYNDDIVVWVVDNNATPAAGATVRLDGSATAVVDERGFATFMNMRAGEYTVTAEHDGITVMAVLSHSPSIQDSGIFAFSFSGPDEVLAIVAIIAIGVLGPIYVIALCFDTISREKLSGSIDYLLVRPMGRRAVLAGKWAGVVGAMMIPITIVSLLGLAIIAWRVDKSPSAGVMAGFLVYTLLLISVFALLQMLLSTVSKTTGTAVLSGIGLWLFFNMLFGIIIVVIDATVGLSDDAATGASFLNPISLYNLSIAGTVDGTLPNDLPMWAPGAGLVVWLVIIMVLAMEIFRRRATV